MRPDLAAIGDAQLAAARPSRIRAVLRRQDLEPQQRVNVRPAEPTALDGRSVDEPLRRPARQAPSEVDPSTRAAAEDRIFMTRRHSQSHHHAGPSAVLAGRVQETTDHRLAPDAPTDRTGELPESLSESADLATLAEDERRNAEHRGGRGGSRGDLAQATVHNVVGIESILGKTVSLDRAGELVNPGFALGAGDRAEVRGNGEPGLGLSRGEMHQLPKTKPAPARDRRGRFKDVTDYRRRSHRRLPPM